MKTLKNDLDCSVKRLSKTMLLVSQLLVYAYLLSKTFVKYITSFTAQILTALQLLRVAYNAKWLKDEKTGGTGVNGKCCIMRIISNSER